ncbi:uncharacterized protein [Rutidosis leptorrhynchoides]|uniref:uncharacterized protein n=1 Tax=Rutidosis leptorrhynchoides TaxID=125765 RepID=UPI003A99AEBC
MVMTRRSSAARVSPAASLSTVEINKATLVRLVSCHQQIKIAFQDLESHIKIGLHEAEEVFQSLSVPLMTLVGLKNKEMATEGRYSSIIISSRATHSEQRTSRDIASGSSTVPQNIGFLGGNYGNKASIAGKELVKSQQTRLSNLFCTLKQVEAQVNSHHNDLLESLANHRATMKKFLEKAVHFLSTVDGKSQEEVFMVSMKIFRAVFEKICGVLGSVENGVDNLMQDLAKEMCPPVVHFVKGLHSDIKQGLSIQFLSMVEEIEISLENGRLQLEEARTNSRIAEEAKREALCKLKETEERVRKLQTGQFGAAHKLTGKKVDDNLLWQMLSKKRKNKLPESPMGADELIYREPKPKLQNITGVITRSRHYAAGLGLSPSSSSVQHGVRVLRRR